MMGVIQLQSVPVLSPNSQLYPSKSLRLLYHRSLQPKDIMFHPFTNTIFPKLQNKMKEVQTQMVSKIFLICSTGDFVTD